MKRTKTKDPLESIFQELEQVHRFREDFIKPNTAIVNQIKAMKRKQRTKDAKDSDVDPSQFFAEIAGNTVFKAAKDFYTKRLDKLAIQLPLHDWYTTFHGCGTTGYGSLLAETGNLSNYANPAKVWKRMGLAVGPDGQADKNRTKGVNTGYNKQRRMIAFRISAAIVQGKKGPYRELYDMRKEYELERDAEGYNAPYIEKNKTFMLKTYRSAPNQAKIKAGRLPQLVINYRAHRYMVKRLIKDLWIEWNKSGLSFNETLCIDA